MILQSTLYVTTGVGQDAAIGSHSTIPSFYARSDSKMLDFRNHTSVGYRRQGAKDTKEEEKKMSDVVKEKKFIIAAPDNFNPGSNSSSSSEPPTPLIPPTRPQPAVSEPLTPLHPYTPTPLRSQPSVAEPIPLSSQKKLPLKLTHAADIEAARQAWKYFERNWNPQTGLVNSVDNLPWTTWWDQGSAILGIHAARQLGLVPQDVFQQRVNTLLRTLENLPLPTTGLPNKAYSTHTAQMRQLNDKPDPKGRSGWSVLDMARFLLGLHVLRTHYPEYRDRINRIVASWNLFKLVKDGWLNGAITGTGEQILEVQEGRFGYEQYAALSLKLWNINAPNAIYNPPVKTVEIDGISLQVDQRNFKNSGATNYLTNDPYLLWGLELGWSDTIQPQVRNLLQVQVQRFKRTGILTAVNEDSLDRPPYFLYYSVYANDQAWNVANTRGKVYSQLRFLSTKAAFSWFALMPKDPYTKILRDFVQNLTDKKRGYFSGQYENKTLGVNASVNVNTNAVVLESLLYQARGERPLVF
ncbi:MULTISPECIES: DUF3131 domain-containing protein [Nostocales]|nr:DUF3131 domain-containing protein [Tolypothrix bouteillei]